MQVCPLSQAHWSEAKVRSSVAKPPPKVTGGPRPRTGGAAVKDQLAALADRYWETLLEASPTMAGIIGDHRFDDRLLCRGCH